MNERIRKLMVESIVDVNLACYDPDKDLNKMYIPNVFAEKFAELIVRECADIARGWSDDYVVEDTAPKQVDMFIKQHFGVEE